MESADNVILGFSVSRTVISKQFNLWNPVTVAEETKREIGTENLGDVRANVSLNDRNVF